MIKLWLAGAAVVAAVVGVLLMPQQDSGGSSGPASSCVVPAVATATPSGPAVTRNVQTVIAQGRAAKVPPQGIQIALAVILVESNGLNLASMKVPESIKYPNDGVAPGDHQSINLFQQQVGMGWFDTVAHGMDPAYAAASFYAHLLNVSGWQTMGFGAAAQATQHSAFPTRYAAKQAEALALYNQNILSGGAKIVPAVATNVCQPATVQAASISGSWANPLKPASYTIGSPFGPRIDPVTGIPGMHWGQDLMVPIGTPVHAECDGVVQLAGWDPYGGGNMTTLDCGGGLTIKNMHQSVLIALTGAKVKAGQVTGLSGSTGHSTGPHLHEEVAINGTRIDPIPFMRARGVPL